MIKVLIVDDQELMLQGLSMIVGKEEDLDVVGLCHNGKEAVEICSQIEIDLVLMDIRMPVMTGVEATKLIKEENDSIKIIILTTFNDDEYIFSSLRNGASGYLLKDATPDEITTAIRKVNKGGTLINPDVATKLVMAIQNRPEIEPFTQLQNSNEINGKRSSIEIIGKGSSIEINSKRSSIEEEKCSIDLTNREKDICHLLAEGKNNKEIGESLMISDGTVKNNITRILDKLDMRDRTQLALFALKLKI